MRVLRLALAVLWVVAVVLSGAQANADCAGMAHEAASAPGETAVLSMTMPHHHEAAPRTRDTQHDHAECGSECCDGACLCEGAPVPAALTPDATPLVAPLPTGRLATADATPGGAPPPNDGPPPRTL